MSVPRDSDHAGDKNVRHGVTWPKPKTDSRTTAGNASLRHHGPDLGRERVDLERFGDEVHAGVDERRAHVLVFGTAGHEQDRQAWRARARHLGELASVEARQAEIA